MTAISAQMIKELRDRTGIGMGKCKEALQEASGDMELAIANLRKAGLAQAAKKMERETNEGIIRSEKSEKAISLIEVNAETDFVVKNEKFQKFSQDLAKEVLQVMPNSVEEFLQSKLSTDSEQTVDQARASIVQTLGENIQVKRVEIFPCKEGHSIGVYSHAGGKLVCLVEISGSDKQQELAKDIAMHIAAEAPEYISSDEIPERVIEHEKEIARAQVAGKPPQIIEKIITGKLNAYFDQVCLLPQKFVKDTSVTIAEHLEKQGKESGESLKITQFLRWQVGAQ